MSARTRGTLISYVTTLKLTLSLRSHNKIPLRGERLLSCRAAFTLPSYFNSRRIFAIWGSDKVRQLLSRGDTLDLFLNQDLFGYWKHVPQLNSFYWGTIMCPLTQNRRFEDISKVLNWHSRFRMFLQTLSVSPSDVKLKEDRSFCRSIRVRPDCRRRFFLDAKIWSDSQPPPSQPLSFVICQCSVET